MGPMVDIAVDRAAVDPDAQAAVTDFLDYTEYLPSDLMRSLALIQGLDETYDEHAQSLHEHTKLYGSLPNLDPASRPNVQELRHKTISTLDAALNARESAYAEACRLFDVVDRHQNRLKSIIAKLHAIPKPPSRDPTPQPPTSTQKRSRTGREIKPGTRLTLNPPRPGVVASAVLARPRGRRVTVPGEVLPPYDPDEAIASTEVSDWDSPPPSPPRPVLKLKQPKPPKESDHDEDSSVPPELSQKGSQDSASYPRPTPPPGDAEIGSKHRPWTHLTEYELYKLRKKMKKNNNWDPSDIMVRRELELRGRGWENYYRARAAAQANGTAFVDIEQSSQQSQPSSATTTQPVIPKLEREKDKSEPAESIMVVTPDVPKTKAAKKIESKKEKASKKDQKTDTAREQAALAAQEAEQAARRLGDIGSAFKNLFSPFSNALASLNRSTSSGTPTAAPKKAEKAPRKRKLGDSGVSASPPTELDTQRKKPRIAVAKASPLPSIASSIETSTTATTTSTTSSTEQQAMQPTQLPQQSAGTIKIPLKLNVGPPMVAVSEASTPGMEARAASVARSSVAPKTEETTPPPPISRPVSRKSTVPPPERGEETPTVEQAVASTRATSRRASATPAAAINRRTPSASVRQTPTIDSSPRGLPTAASRRPRREVPGTVTQSSQDGGPAVSVSKRKNKPGKQKKAASNTSPEVRVDIDGRAEIVDPSEERYCICGDVSYGEMICCELDEKVHPLQAFPVLKLTDIV
jgi:hypothetical protein